MPAGLSNRFTILPQSPHDAVPEPLAASAHPQACLQSWVPSHYTIRATADDGRLILWNTFRGSMSVFKAEQAGDIKELLVRKGIQAEPEGIVGYLVDKGFLIRESANEYRQVQSAIHQQHFRTDRLELILLASEDCNFRCKYCYEEFQRGTMLPEVRAGVKNLVRQSAPGLRSLQIRWFGGEPLYGFSAIEDLAPFFSQVCDEQGLSFSSHMTTNGYLLTPDVAGRLLDWRINDFQITVDGLAEHHDQNRPTREGHSTFQRIFDNLVALAQRDADFLVHLRFNFDRHNSADIPEFMDLLEHHLGKDPRFQLHLFPIGKWGGEKDDELEVCGKDEVDQIIRDFQAEAHRRGIGVGTLKDVNYLGSGVCYAARPFNMIVGATGKLMKCTIALDTEEHNVVGTLQEDGSTNIDPDKWALWTEPAFENDTQCQKCVVLPVCQGTHCPLIRIDEDRSPCTPLRRNAKPEMIRTLTMQQQGRVLCFPRAE